MLVSTRLLKFATGLKSVYDRSSKMFLTAVLLVQCLFFSAQAQNLVNVTNTNGGGGAGITGTYTVSGGLAYKVRMTAKGAKGGTANNAQDQVGGDGAVIVGEFYLSSGQSIEYVAGSTGQNYTYIRTGGAGGGGGSGVRIKNASIPLILAGGGGGGGEIAAGGTSNASGGTGNGGNGSNSGAGGGGLNSAGGYGLSYRNGGGAGFNASGGNNGAVSGGCGYGGGGCSYYGGGGGGGYTGGDGGGGNINGYNGIGGGGGTSFNTGANQINNATTNSGGGAISIDVISTLLASGTVYQPNCSSPNYGSITINITGVYTNNVLDLAYPNFEYAIVAGNSFSGSPSYIPLNSAPSSVTVTLATGDYTFRVRPRNSPQFYMEGTFTILPYVAGIHIPDPNFAAALHSMYPSVIDACDNLTAAAATLTNVSPIGKSISDLTGIEGFTKVTYINCSNNPLGTLPKFPASLLTLYCTGDALTSIPSSSLPSGLQYLDCSNNSLTTLPTLPTTLGGLTCYFNNITCLPTLPPSLRNLSLDASKISCLPNAVSGLNVYNYGSNRPTAFPVCTISTPIANVTQPTCALPTGTITITTPVGAGYTYSLDGGVATSATSFTSVATSVHSVVAYGNCATSTATSVTVNAVQVSNGIHIPDANFAAAISSQCPTCIDACNNLTSAAGSLTSLFVGSKSISDLTGIGGFTSLVTLFCNNNNLTSLPALPNSIKDLECQNNQLTLLPALLPTSLDRFYCDNNNLTSLPSLPPGMTSVLSCVGNKIQSLPMMLPNLQNIFCTGNLIATLPALPNALQTLRCSGNLITSLPTLPNFLSILQIDYPQISCLPNKPTFLNVITNASGVNITSVIKLCCTAPTITAQTAPTTQTVCHGGNTTDLSVASSDPTASYQWYSNTTNSNSGGTIIIKAVAPNYTPSSTIDGTTYYYCVVTANCGSSTASNPVVVNVNQVALTPLISGSNTVGQCSTITLNAQPTGGTWSSNSTNATISSTGIVSGISIGQATISYSYTASNGCIGTVGFTLNVTPDVTPPVKPTLADVNAECLVASLTAPTTTDNCTGIVTGTTSTVFPITTQGTTIVTWTFADGNGNSTTATQNVIVKDVTAPVKPTLTDVTAECSATPAVPKTTDNCAGTVTGTTSTVFPITTQGTTIVTWTFADGNGNSVTANQNVIIKDVTAPVKPTLTDVTAECSVASIAAPTTTDNCAGTISGTTPIVFPITTQGTTIVTWTFDDGNGNSVTANQNVIIKDVTAPVKPTLADVTAECSVASIAAPTTTDNCAGTITGTTPIVFPITTQGTTIVTWTFDDGNGNSVTANQNVIIKDVTAPVKPTLTDVTAECSATPTAPTTTDNCAGTVTGTTSTVFPITKQGTTIVTWTFADGNGNSTTATQNVIIKDVTPPVQPILANVTAECSVASIAAPKTTDNCAGTITGTTSTVFPITKQGTTIVTWTFADGNGNSTTSTQNVIIKDVTPPVQPILTDVTAECSASPIAPTTTDNCAGTITGTTSTVFPITTQGTTIVTWTFADGNGNSTTATQNVIIKDITPPVKPTLADVTAECLATPIVPKTTDNCAGTVTGTTSTVFPITTQGTTIVTWTFADGNGNSTTATQNVIIKDITPPVKPTLADVTAECLATPIVPKTTDNCAGAVTGTTSTVFPITTQGTTIVTWTFADGNGNSTTATQNVIIKDVTPPVQPILTNITAECSVASIAAPTTTDNCAGTITGTTSTVFPIIKQGTTIVTWTFADGNGNSTTATQNVIIKDVTPPVQPILANVTAECSATPTAPTTTDNCAGTITGTPTLRTRPGATSIFPITTQGTTIVTWTFSDGNGNLTTATQNVIIKDVTPPVQPTLANVTAECSATPTAPTTTDNCAGTVTGTTSTVFPIIKQGITIVTWTFADGNGNSTTATQNVIIKDVTPPVQPTLANVTAECSVVSIAAPTTTDNCAGTITGTTSTVFPITNQGTTVVTWTFTDGNGNSTTATQNVIIKDVTPPVQPTLVNVTAECSVPSIAAPTTTDNCAGTITGTTSTIFPITKQGTTIVTWNFSDGNGNSTTATQNVIIKDVTPPVQPTLANVTAECSVAYIAAPKTLDNCAGTVTGTTSTVFPISKQGTTIVTWNFSDGNGNSTTATQNVIIKDVTPPVQPILTNVTAECSVASIAAPTTTDNCAGTITGTTSTVFPITKQGTTIVTWNFSDGNGNSTTATQNVIIKDVTPPVQPTLANVTAECSVAYIAAPKTLDNCAGTVTGTTSTVFPISKQGTTIVTWNFSDGNGNSTTATQNVIIKDVTPPVQPILTNVTAECSVASIAAPTTTDNCAGTITGTTSTVFPITKQGTTIVTWNFSDGNGNSTTATQNVIIKDVTPPVQPILTNVTAECSVASIAAPTTTDNCAGTITGTTSTVFPITKQGTTIVTWNFSDGNGNSTTATQNVIIKDVTPPVQPTLANVTAECSVAYIAAPKTLDNCAGTVTGTTSTVFPISKQGTTIVTWNFSDGNGNSTTATQNVIIKDVTPPVQPILTNVTAECSVASIAAPTTTDNCAGTITGTTSTVFPITKQGTTIVTWTFADGNGNSTTATQNVILKDVTKPTIACPTTPSPVNNTDAGICGAKVTFANATATDNCTPSSGIKIGSTPISGSVFSVGNTQVTFTATDLAGNFSTCSFTVSVSSKAAFDPSVCYNILNNGKPIVLDGDNAQIYSAKQTKVQSFKMIALSNGNIQILSSSDKNAKKSLSDDAPKGDLKVNVKDYKSDGQSDWQINCVNGAYVITHQASGQVLTVGVAQNDGKIPVVLSGASGGANSSQTWTFQAVACPVLDNSLQSRNESDTRAYADGTRNTVQFTTKNGNTMHTLTAEKQNATTGVFEDFEEHNTDELTDKIQSHTFYDNTPTGGINVYRVKTVYYNGVVEYSSQKLVNRKSNSDFIVYPNPAKGEATIILDQTENQELHLEVINTLGKTMFTDVIQTTTSSTYRLDVSNYASGLYFIKLQTPDSQILTQKLQVAK